jgi:hypothetical protein
MVRAMKSQLLSLPVVLAAGCALPGVHTPQQPANAPTISTNRPSFSDAASLVPAGHLQVETGYTFTKRNREGVETERHTGPEVLARYRVLDRLEAQLLWGGYAWQDTASGGESTADDGATDLGVGVRVPIAEQDGWLPQLALGGIATLGTGHGAFSTNDHTVPTGKILWAYTLDGGYGLGGNLIVSYPYDGEQRFDQVAASVYGTKALDDRTTLFGEYYVVTPYANGTGPAHTVDGGVLFIASRTVQLDARIGFGLNDEADDCFVGAGISFLF